MIRRISTKWVLAVLAAVVVPFVGFALFVNTKVSDRLAGDVVRYHLLSIAGDLADRIDEEIAERRIDIRMLASYPTLEWFVDPGDPADIVFEEQVQDGFKLFVELSEVYDLVLAVDARGRYVVSNRSGRDGRPLSEDVLAALQTRDYSQEVWFQLAMGRGEKMVDVHVSDLLPREAGEGELPSPSDYHVGFAERIEGSSGDGPVGVVYALMNWEVMQRQVSSYGVRQLLANTSPEGSPLAGQALGEDIYQSSYAWIWKSDANTIIAHKDRSLYGKLVSGPDVGLPQLVDAAREAEWGMYPPYTYRGAAKKAAFKHCNGVQAGGFGWIVGVGIDDADIYAPVHELSRLLFTASAIVLAIAVLWTIWIARRTTRPILELSNHTRRIATSGDLDARIEIDTQDELGGLAEDFNRMTAKLKEQREQLVSAEKDRAWREMARQVAHEIKNPLTPISLSVGLVRRSRNEGSPDFDRILDRTLEMIERQVETMRDVTRDFYAFAGEHRAQEAVELGQVLADVLDLHAGMAEHQHVQVLRSGSGGVVQADPNELHRAVLNLVQNAFEAMPEGGELRASVETVGAEVVLEIRDSGDGVPPEVATHLFEPYFTTRSSGTGLGLAIVRRVVEDMGGSVTLTNASAVEGGGALATVRLPRYSAAARRQG